MPDKYLVAYLHLQTLVVRSWGCLYDNKSVYVGIYNIGSSMTELLRHTKCAAYNIILNTLLRKSTAYTVRI